MKPDIQTAFNHKVMNTMEALDSLGWKYTKSENSFDDIMCSCGGELEFSGYFGTERIECKKCGKYMVNVFSPMQSSPVTVTIVNPDDYEPTDREWIATDKYGKMNIIKV
jgi:hypothetical protein